MLKEIKQEWIKLNLLNEKQTESAQKKWNKYYNDTYSDVVKVGEYFFPIEKSRMKKDFCFGYGLNGVSTEEEYTGAVEMKNHASKNEKYFLDENLNEINEEIKVLEAYIKNIDNLYNFHEDLRKNELDRYNYDGKIFLYSSYRNRDYQVNYTFYNNLNEYHPYKNFILREATKEEIEIILNALIQEKENFTKRLQTYLKRYGTSKLRTWTYLVD